MNYSIDEIRKIVLALDYTGTDKNFITEIKAATDQDHSLRSITWVSDKNSDTLKKISNTNVILSSQLASQVDSSSNLNLFIVEQPRRSFALLMKEIASSLQEKPSIHNSAVIDESAVLGRDVFIGPNVYIGKNVRIQDNVSIGANTCVLDNTIVADFVTIGSNSTIGGVGFGYELNDEGQYELIPHLGNVIIKNNVEIGNNVCIDRAVLGSTLIGENVKIDNLVHIAHGVSIGKNSLIIANSMIAGSCQIGENVWVAPSSSVLQKLVLADNSLVGMGSVVVKNVEANSVVAGVPARKIRDK
jgi:UDP-3-O-[3-hydroxymyristoyl] glucosamine N-acyltransferase